MGVVWLVGKMGQPMALFAPHAFYPRYQKLTTIVEGRGLA